MGSCNNTNTISNSKHTSKRHSSNKFNYLFKSDFIKNFQYISIISKGKLGGIRLYNEISSSKIYAVKLIFKKNLKSKYISQTLRPILKDFLNLNHENISKFYDLYEDINTIYIVMEYVQGENLLRSIIKRNHVSYKVQDIANISLIILNSILYLHSKGIIHNDIKPENIIFTNSDISSLKIIDFGIPLLGTNVDFNSISPFDIQNISPEILNSSIYTNKSDSWSFGIILYILSIGRHPFYSEDISIEKMIYKIKNGDYSKEEFYNNSELCDELKDLIVQCLEIDYNKRIDLQDAYTHDFYKNERIDKTEMSKEVLNDISLYCSVRYSQQELLIYIIKLGKYNLYNMIDLHNRLSSLFHEVDYQKTGFISLSFFKNTIEAAISNNKNSEIVNSLLGKFDNTKEKGEIVIKYETFLSDYIRIFMDFVDEEIYRIYLLIDKDSKGFISYEDVESLENKEILNMNPRKEIFNLFELNKNEKITFEKLREIYIKDLENISSYINK